MLFTLIAVIGLFAAVFSVMSSVSSVTEKRPQLLLIPHEELEQAALRVFEAEEGKARSTGRLIESGSEFDRIHAIVERIKVAAIQLYSPAQHWKWRTALVDQETINASCGTGGKLMFYSGLWRTLKLTNDEFAIIVGHEIAHALREHTRERLSHEKVKGLLFQQFGQFKSGILSVVPQEWLNKALKLIYHLPFCRSMEMEADALGMEIAARVGYKPEAALTLWKKLQTVSIEGNEFLATHPPIEQRIAKAEELLPLLKANMGKPKMGCEIQGDP